MLTLCKINFVLVLVWCTAGSATLANDTFTSSLERLAAVDTSDSPDAVAAAWKVVATTDLRQLPQVLAAIDSSQPVAANWLRAAADAMAERGLAHDQPLPIAELEQFVANQRHDPRARRLAFEWLRKAQPQRAESLIPAMLQDPSVELRRESVALRMEQAERSQKAGEREQAIAAYRQALAGARDEDQVKELAKRLRGLDQQIDLPQHFGFIQKWQLIAPFDNTGQTGLERVYPPETEINLQAEYAGKGEPARWQAFVGQDDFGLIDFNKPFGQLKEVVGYAWTEFQSDAARPVELRLGCKNAWKVWLNGQLLFSRNEYHRGMQLDQYRLPGELKPGTNEILVKLCQNEQTESWTVEWQFQLRVCDSTGTAILSGTLPPAVE